MYDKSVIDHPPFQLHIEPDQPIELDDMLRCLSAVGHQFQIFAASEGLSASKDAKLLISSVKPGSIDIGLLPDLSTLGTLLAPALVYSPHVLKFMTALKTLVDKFRAKPDLASTSVRECSDVVAILKPTATAGGSQTFNVHNGDNHYHPVLIVNAVESREIIQIAQETRALLTEGENETRQRVPMIWHGLDTDDARTTGKRNPDRATIEEIDPTHRPVFFEDDFASLKREMIDDQENPYRKIHFVDVKVSRVAGKVVSYRITGFHGSEDVS